MIALRKSARERKLVKRRLPLALIGIDVGAFIANKGWTPNIAAADVFKLKYFAAQDEARAADLRLEYPEEDGYFVHHDYRAVIRRAREECGDDLVVAICTPDHIEHLKACIELGVRCVMVEKPPVNNMAEWAEVNLLAEEKGCKILVSFQHECNAPTHEMARRIAAHVEKHGPDSVIVHGFFNQGWVLDGPDNWRIYLKYCGLKDIGTHAARGLCRITNSWIAEVTSSMHRKSRRARLEAAALDNGEVEVTFANGIKGTVTYTHVDPRYADDIGWEATLTDPDTGVVQKLLWRLDWGAAEVLYIGDAKSSLDDIGTWTAHLRGHSAEFSAESNALYDKQPCGHMQGWSDLYVSFFLNAWRIFLRHLGYELAEHLVDLAYAHCPDFRNAGLDSSVFADMAVLSFEDTRPVKATEITDPFGVSPETRPFQLCIPN